MVLKFKQTTDVNLNKILGESRNKFLGEEKNSPPPPLLKKNTHLLAWEYKK